MAAMAGSTDVREASLASRVGVEEQERLVEAEQDVVARSVGHSVVRRNRRLILGGVLATALAAGVLWKTFAPCVESRGISDDSANSFVTLAEQYPEDLNDLLGGRSDEDAHEKWLAAAHAVGAAAAQGQTTDAAARSQEAVRRAMEVSDPVEAEKIVKRAMARAVQKSQSKRRELKKLIKGPHHFLKGHKKPKKEEQTTTGAPKASGTHDSQKSPKEDHASKGGHASAKDHSEDHTSKARHTSAKDHPEDHTSKDGHASAKDRSADEGQHKKSVRDMINSVRSNFTTTLKPRNKMGEHHAKCVFNVLSATNTFAALAANLNDVAKTCENVKGEDMFSHERTPEHVHAKVCEVNVFAVLNGIVSLATSLANSADSCAATLIPNVDAKCSASVTGLVTAVAQIGGSFTLISAACKGDGWYADIPEGRFPHNVGSNEVYEQDVLHKGAKETPSARRLLAEGPGVVSEEATEPAPPRQLLFGGGRGSTATQCAVELGSVMWSLASAGLAINSAGNENGPTCPPANLWGNEDPKLKGTVYEVSQGLCATDVESAITSFLSVIAVLQLVAVNCVDTLNIRAICGAGVTGVFAASAGLAQAATGLWLTCGLLQDEPLHKLITSVRSIDKNTGLITDMMAGDSNFGRRLAAVRGSIADLQQRFETPEEAWKSIGYDLNNASAVFRKAGLPGPDLKAFASLVEEPEVVKDGGAGLFGSQQTCSD